MNKIKSRARRGMKAKAIIRSAKSNRPRLVVFRSSMHIYCQVVVPGPQGDEVIASSSSLDKELRDTLKGNKCEQAHQVGMMLAKRAKEKDISAVAFDRSGFKYHGRIRSLAEGAREGGMNF